MKAPTERFSDRVEDYVKYRPSYPAELIEHLRDHCGLGAGSTVADIGSGTGIFTHLLLATGCRVLAVEPNDAMRHAAERRLGSAPGFHSVTGTAEQTGLDDDAVDLITAAQAFHWFQKDRTRREFQRIGKSGSFVALVWNQRKTDSAFHDAYDLLLQRHAPEYNAVNQRMLDDTGLVAFLGPADYRCVTFDNCQHFDLDGFKGRLQSSSYAPLPGAPGHAELMAGLEGLFEIYAEEGRLAFEYETKLYLGRLSAD